MFPYGMHPHSVKQMVAHHRKLLEELEKWAEQASKPQPAHAPVFHDNGDHWVFRAHLPHADKGTVRVKHDNGWLHVETKGNNQTQLTAPGMWQMAQHLGHWQWVLPVPQGTKPDSIKHEWDGDTLSIRLPKHK